MELDRLIRRQAIGNWRDGHILAALELFNSAGKASLAALEAGLPRAGAADLWDPDVFAAREVDPLMRARLEDQLTALMAEAAADLEALGAPYAALANALAEESHIPWPSPLPAPIVPAELPVTAPTEQTDSTLTWLTTALGSMARNAAETIGQLSDQAGHVIKDRTGLHNRLRYAARRRIADAWMGESTQQQRPVLSHIILMLDETANQARTMV